MPTPDRRPLRILGFIAAPFLVLAGALIAPFVAVVKR